MDVKDKLIRARIQIQRKNPFFAYLSLHLKFKEKKDFPEHAGCGVDIDGNFYYKKEFIEEISDDELIGVMVHEILHLSLLHLLRRGGRDADMWNIAADVASNIIVKDCGYNLPEGCLEPDYGDEITIFGKKIKKCKEKTTEQIFELLPPITKKMLSKDGKEGKGFDEHIEGKGSSSDKQKKEEEWLGKIEEAYVNAKMRGDVPAGIERAIGKLHEHKVDWKTLLQRHIISYIPYDNTYIKPNKKSVSSGYYMPDYIKDKIDVVAGIDTSGSIGKEELNDFLSEIIGIAKGFQNRVSIRVLTHDVDVHTDYLAENGNLEKIKNIKIKGGGGTSHKPILDYIEKEIPNCKVAVFFTDGYSDLDEIDLSKYGFDKIFVIDKGGTDEQVKNEMSIKL